MGIKIKLAPIKELPKWDLSVAFYKDIKDPQIEVDKKSIEKLTKELTLWRGIIDDMEPYELSVFLRKYEAVIELVFKLSNYAHLYSDTHKKEEEANVFQAKIREHASKVFEKLNFIHFEMNGLPEYKKIEFLNHPKLQRWIPWLMSLFDGYWAMSEGISFIINKKSLVSSAWSRMYEETCAELKFRLNGKTYNEAEFIKFFYSSNPDVRHKVAEEMNRVYGAHSRVFTMCYNMILKDKSVDDEIYGIDEPVEESLLSNNIEKEDLLAMVNEVTDSYIPISHRFYKLMAKMQGVEQLRYEDRNINPVKISEKKISWRDCMQQVLEAYGEFSLEYLDYAMQIINSGIIDVPPYDGKVDGGYCIRGEYPYILLNFTGSPRDVATFGHELGHGVHHILSAQVGRLNDSTPTALAEVASEFAESLIFKKQMENADSDIKKLSLLIDHVRDMINSIHRQIFFYKFEERTHKERKNGELTTKRLGQIWREEASRCYGFDIGEHSENMWMRISHIFDMPYYVYSYAFAGLIVNNLINAYEKWDEKGEFEVQEAFADLYIDMLCNTGIEDFKSLLEPFGIDAYAPDFWSKGLKVISDYIDEIERLAAKEGLI